MPGTIDTSISCYMCSRCRFLSQAPHHDIRISGNRAWEAVWSQLRALSTETMWMLFTDRFLTHRCAQKEPGNEVTREINQHLLPITLQGPGKVLPLFFLILRVITTWLHHMDLLRPQGGRLRILFLPEKPQPSGWICIYQLQNRWEFGLHPGQIHPASLDLMS